MSKSDIDLDKITSDFKKIVQNSSNEEFARHAAQIVESIADHLGLPMETHGYSLVSGKRTDTLYNHVLIEYRAPKLSPVGFEEAKTQIINHITSEAEVKERFSSFFGIIISDTITFVKYDEPGDWIIRGPHTITKRAILKIVVALRGLTRKKLCCEELLSNFGPQSEVTSTITNVLYGKLNSADNSKINLLFEDWVRIFSQITGYTEEDLKGLDELYDTGRKDYTKLLFCIHTYYALLVKMIAAEVAYVYGTGRYLKSYVTELEDKYAISIKGFRKCLENLEKGILFTRLLKIRNFIEGSYFSWYLEEFDKDLMDVIAEIARKLSDYEFATSVLAPKESTDVLKMLYQELVPPLVRHNLGEYYTPEWLAQFLLDRVGYTVESFEKMTKDPEDVTRVTTPLKLRLLDPACGSGTFLIEALKRLRCYAEDKCMTDVMAESICENIVGIDCNPLAVLAAKTNYLLHVGDLLDYDHEREIPVYCADSLTIDPAEYILPRFDYVVGNPPWVLWDNLPIDYRKNTQELWRDYGLFTLPASQARHGGGKKDISILFTYACADKYLKDAGIFGFLITQSVFKTKGAGEGFRQFIVKGTNLKVIEVHDFVNVNPFEGTNNRTAAIIFKKGEKTVYPVKYRVWRALSGIDPEESLKTASKKLHPIEMAALPSGFDNELSPWVTVPHHAVTIVQKVYGTSKYPVYAGIYSGGVNSVYWVKILDMVAQSKKTLDISPSLRKTLDIGENILVRELLVENITKGMKRKVKKVKTIVEDFFVYPLIKSKHVKKWKINGYTYTLQMQNPVKRIGFNEEWVKKTFPKTYRYLKGFKKELNMRKSSVVRQLLQKGPFYTMYAVGEYTYAPYKVVWSRMGSQITACVISKAFDDFIGEKIVLPENVLAFIPTDNEDEAHYVCALMNSSVTNMILRSIAKGTKSFATPKIVEDTIRIPLYNKNNELHRKLCSLSKQAHENAQKNKDTNETEEEIDKTVAILYGISEEDLHTVKEILLI